MSDVVLSVRLGKRPRINPTRFFLFGCEERIRWYNKKTSNYLSLDLILVCLNSGVYQINIENKTYKTKHVCLFLLSSIHSIYEFPCTISHFSDFFQLKLEKDDTFSYSPLSP